MNRLFQLISGRHKVSTNYLTLVEARILFTTMTVTYYGSIAASIAETDESGLNDSLNTSLLNPILGAKSSILYRNRKVLGKQNTCAKRKTKHRINDFIVLIGEKPQKNRF